MTDADRAFLIDLRDALAPIRQASDDYSRSSSTFTVIDGTTIKVTAGEIRRLGDLHDEIVQRLEG